MADSHFFDQLMESVGLISRHADFPGKRQIVDRCREEVEDLSSSGLISPAQAETLLEILGVSFQAAS
jgi:hypothetical protein